MSENRRVSHADKKEKPKLETEVVASTPLGTVHKTGAKSAPVAAPAPKARIAIPEHDDIQCLNWWYKYSGDLYPEEYWLDLFKKTYKEARLRRFIFQDVDEGKPVMMQGSVDQPADKQDVAAIRLDIRRKQESYVKILGENLSKLATKFSALEHDYQATKFELKEFQRKAEGMLGFTYAICKRTSSEVFHDDQNTKYQRGLPSSGGAGGYARYNQPAPAGNSAVVDFGDEFPKIPDF